MAEFHDILAMSFLMSVQLTEGMNGIGGSEVEWGG